MLSVYDNKQQKLYNSTCMKQAPHLAYKGYRQSKKIFIRPMLQTTSKLYRCSLAGYLKQRIFSHEEHKFESDTILANRLASDHNPTEDLIQQILHVKVDNFI